MSKPLIEFNDVDVILDGHTILRDITWQLRPGEHWAILGGNGSGKSTLLRLIRAELWPAPGKGKRTYAFDGEEQTSAVGIKEKIALVSPELQERYLQQEWNLTGRQVLHSGFFNTDYVYRTPDAGQKAFAQTLVRLLRIQRLMDRNFQQLSTGELRKLLIARALAGKPRVAVLDEVCDGLDAPSRAHLLEVIEGIARAGTQILYTTHRSEEVVSAITHVMLLDKGRIVQQADNARHHDCEPLKPAKEWKTSSAAFQRAVWPARNRQPLHNSKCPGVFTSDAASKAATQQRANVHDDARRSEVFIRLQSANVFLNRKRVLQDIHWEMRARQNWVFFGPNGAGKSTFLKLIAGDLHPAVGAQIHRFGLTEKHTIWDLKRHLGYLAPDFQAHYRERLTGAEAIASGFFSTIGLLDKVSRRQKMKVGALLDSFRLGALAGKNVLQMSYGEFRKVLLLRALVHEPQVLICDEPFDGLDGPSKAEFVAALEHVSRNGTRLIAVTHHWDDLPRCITHALLLEKGRIVCQGHLDVVRTHRATQRLFAPA